MRAARCRQYGDVADLVVADAEDPTPGPGEVVVAIGSAAVNFPDILLVAGTYQVKLPLPFTPGSELAGEVVEVGADVEQLQVGDRVCGTVFCGAFGERLALPAASLTKIPDEVSFDDAAAFSVTYTTAFHALHTIGDLQPGQWVVVLGGAGGVGSAAIDLAHGHGARVVAAASSAEKLEACREAGAEVTIDYERDDLKVAIKEATGGGAHLVVDPVGGRYSEQSLRALRPGGRHVIVGFASGVIPSLPLNLVLVKAVSVHGLDLRQVYGDQPHLAGETTSRLLDLLRDGRIHPQIDARFPLDDVVLALQRVQSRQAVGKVIVNPAGGA